MIRPGLPPPISTDGWVLSGLEGAVASASAYHHGSAERVTPIAPIPDYAQLQLHVVDRVQRRYAVIRPIVLIGDRTAAQRAEETQFHPETVRNFTRRFRQHGMLGLFPKHTDDPIAEVNRIAIIPGHDHSPHLGIYAPTPWIMGRAPMRR